MTLCVAFEASDLYPDKGGLYTYASRLLQHLGELDDAPVLTLLDGQGYSSMQSLRDANGAALPVGRFVGTKAWPLLHRSQGPWQKDYRTRRLAYAIDSKTLMPLWRRADSIPFLTRWRFPRDFARNQDLCHWPFEGVFTPLQGVAHVATVHDTIVLRYPQWLNNPTYVADHTYKLRAMARYASRIIADSEHTRRDVVDLLAIALERIDVVPLAAGPEFCPPTNLSDVTDTLARYGLRRGRYIFFVGILSERKNVVRLATAFKAAVDRTPGLTMRLVLAGKRGWMVDAIYQALEELGLGERLVLPGRVAQEDLPRLLAGARAVAYVSLYEGFGLPALEAMACGTPVVASNTTSIPEVVGDAGLLVDPYDVAAIAEALHRLMTDDALRAELAARGLRRAAHFSWQRTAALTMDTYRRALACARPAGNVADNRSRR